MATAEKLSIDRYLAACLQIEEMAAEIYRYWSHSSPLTRESQKLWRELESEEQTHIHLIEMLRRTARVSEIGVRMLIDDQVLKMVEYARSCLVRIKVSHTPSRVALFLAIRMKERCAHFYTTQSITLLDREIDQTFRKLSRDDKNQSRRLRQIYVDCCEADTAPVPFCAWPAHCVTG